MKRTLLIIAAILIISCNNQQTQKDILYLRDLKRTWDTTGDEKTKQFIIMEVNTQYEDIDNSSYPDSLKQFVQRLRN